MTSRTDFLWCLVLAFAGLVRWVVMSVVGYRLQLRRGRDG